MKQNDKKVLILGIGNILWADEGFGVRAVETLNRQYEFPPHVRLMDGGTQGIYLLQHVQAADYLVVFDAVDYGLAPGTLKLVEGDEVPRFMGARKMSLHQTGFQEVLSMAALLGDLPEKLLLAGVQPQELEDYGGSLRPVVKAQIAPAIEAVLEWLSRLGIEARRRKALLTEAAPLTPPEIDLEAYERDRPSPREAPRTGDVRVLRRTDIRFDPKPLDRRTGYMTVHVDRRRQD